VVFVVSFLGGSGIWGCVGSGGVVFWAGDGAGSVAGLMIGGLVGLVSGGMLFVSGGSGVCGRFGVVRRAGLFPVLVATVWWVVRVVDAMSGGVLDMWMWGFVRFLGMG